MHGTPPQPRAARMAACPLREVLDCASPLALWGAVPGGTLNAPRAGISRGAEPLSVERSALSVERSSPFPPCRLAPPKRQRAGAVQKLAHSSRRLPARAFTAVLHLPHRPEARGGGTPFARRDRDARAQAPRLSKECPKLEGPMPKHPAREPSSLASRHSLSPIIPTLVTAGRVPERATGLWVGWASRLPGFASRGTLRTWTDASAGMTSARCWAGRPARQAGRPPYLEAHLSRL